MVKGGIMSFNRPMNYTDGVGAAGIGAGGTGGRSPDAPEYGAEAHLNRLFAAYREAVPDPEPGVDFMPRLWARIEERQNSSRWFGRLAKGLVTAAVAVYVILAMMTPQSQNAPSAAYFNGTFVDALVAEHVSSLEPFHIERVSQARLDPEPE